MNASRENNNYYYFFDKYLRWPFQNKDLKESQALIIGFSSVFKSS